MPYSIGILEDNQTLMDLIEKILLLEGYQPFQLDPEKDTDEILQTLQQEKPNLLITDVHLRNTDGFDLMKKMRNLDELQNIKIIIISGTDLTYKSEKEGADGFILKPFMPDEMIQKIRYALCE